MKIILKKIKLSKNNFYNEYYYLKKLAYLFNVK